MDLPPARYNRESELFFAEGLDTLPLYPYRCTQCGHRLEKIQRFNDEPEKTCPECGGELERLLTAPGLSFKGSGWYVNDYAPKSGSAASESKPDAKPETKSDAKTKAPAAESSAAAASPAPAAPATPAAAPKSSAKKD
ncbi:MAG TPA: FmdB family zinc ribbon protein [Terracidiphilus sp.]|nr:FmdB family zinc ribbon protein [Terracidiphilus sp.]